MAMIVFNKTRLTILGAAVVAGALAHYGWWDGGGWFFRSDMSIGGNLALMIAIGFCIYGITSDDK